MTRQEITGKRNLDFSQWVRKNLPDSDTGYSATDLDMILYNWKTKRFLILETKVYNGKMRNGQKFMFMRLNNWLKNGVSDGWRYYGFHLIVFENTCFSNGQVYLNGKKSSEEEIKKLLSLLDE